MKNGKDVSSKSHDVKSAIRGSKFESFLLHLKLSVKNHGFEFCNSNMAF